MKTLYTLFIISFIGPSLFAQNNLIQWQKSYGGTSYDGAYQIKQTSDGGYIICGYSWSNDGDVKGHHGSNGYYPDGWVMKLTASGDTAWTKSLGGTWDDYANAIIETSDGNFVVALQSQSDDGDVSTPKGGWDYWIVKLSFDGNIIWEKSYGGANSDKAYSLVQATDGNYVIAGFTNSNNGDVTGLKGGYDYWIIKADSANGNIIWQKTFGGTDYDYAYSIANTSDSGFAVTGYTWSDDIDVTVNNGYADYWVLKLDSAGTKQWQKSLGGQYYEYGNSIMQTSDGGYIIAGESSSDDGDVSMNYGNFDYWVVKLNSTGTNIEWEKSYGGSMADAAYSIVQTTDNGYMVAGYTKSNDNDVSGNHGVDDYWMAKLDNSGAIQWSSVFGGDSLDYCFGMIQTSDGGYALAGLTRSFNGDVTANKGEVDLWIVKTRCLPPVIPEICLVTVDSSSTKNLVVWEKPATEGIDSFRIYRDIVGIYTNIGSVAYDDLSKFTDTTNGINPNITSYKYKISTIDTCGNESPLSVFHKTMHLQINSNVNLSWDNYSGFTSGFFYRILRDTIGNGNFVVVDSIANSNTQWTDIAPPVQSTAIYVIEIVHPTGGCEVTKVSENHNSSRSNKNSSAPVSNIPVADFSVSTANVCVGGSVNFSDGSTNNPTSWNWTFTGGNPNSSTQKNPQNITYNTPGCYDVKLVVSNSSGSDSIINTCQVNVTSGGTAAPIAGFTSSAININAGDSISFFDISTNTPNTWQWIFTNGIPSMSSAQNPQNIKYNTPGCFAVTITAGNCIGSNTKTETCYITVSPVSGIAESGEKKPFMKIIPNPNNGKFSVIFENNNDIAEFTITTVLGQTVETLKNPEFEIINNMMEISIPEKGIYFLQSRTNNGKINTQKLIVE